MCSLYVLLICDAALHENTFDEVSSVSEGPGPSGDIDPVVDISDENDNFPDENMEVS